jgi:hypothetical protein
MKSQCLILFSKSALNATVPLWTDEPAYGLANRLARRNGVNSLASFGGDHKIPFREIIFGLRNQEVASLAGADPAALEAATFRVGDDQRVRLKGEELHRDDWSYTNLRICPSCLRSDLARKDGRIDYLPHIRSWWNVTSVTVCPIHKEPLIDNYPGNATAAVDHLATDIRFAAGLTNDLAGVISTVSVEDVHAESYILGRLGFMPRVGNPLLDSLPLWNAIRLIDRLGAVAAAGVRSFTSFGGDVTRHDALAAGYRIFADGRQGLFAFLDGLVASADIERGKWGASAVYGRVYEWLSHDTRDQVYDPIRELVREHALDNLPLAPEDRLFGKPVGERRLYTLWHASRAFDTAPSAARTFLKALGHLSAADEEKPNWQIILKASVVDLVKSEVTDRLNYNEARAYLALPRAPMQAIFDEGILKPFLPVSSGVNEHMFRRRDLDQFLADMLGEAPNVQDEGGALCNIVIAGKRSQTSTSEVVSALLAGRIKCQGVTWPVFSSLIELGYISATSSPMGLRNRKQLLVDLGSLAGFMEAYVSATEVAALRGTHVRTLVPELRLRNIVPAIEKTAVGQYFYRRTDIPLLPMHSNRTPPPNLTRALNLQDRPIESLDIDDLGPETI